MHIRSYLIHFLFYPAILKIETQTKLISSAAERKIHNKQKYISAHSNLHCYWSVSPLQ